jgi:hypothetical protein
MPCFPACQKLPTVHKSLPFQCASLLVFARDTKDTISTLAGQPIIFDTGGMKRTVQVNVKMTQEDFDLLLKAAEKRWPDAVMTNSGVVLGLAKIAAKETLGRTTASKKTPVSKR